MGVLCKRIITMPKRAVVVVETLAGVCVCRVRGEPGASIRTTDVSLAAAAKFGVEHDRVALWPADDGPSNALGPAHILFEGNGNAADDGASDDGDGASDDPMVITLMAACKPYLASGYDAILAVCAVGFEDSAARADFSMDATTDADGFFLCPTGRRALFQVEMPIVAGRARMRRTSATDVLLSLTADAPFSMTIQGYGDEAVPLVLRAQPQDRGEDWTLHFAGGWPLIADTVPAPEKWVVPPIYATDLKRPLTRCTATCAAFGQSRCMEVAHAACMMRTPSGVGAIVHVPGIAGIRHVLRIPDATQRDLTDRGLQHARASDKR
jgi:hypothetical protein